MTAEDGEEWYRVRIPYLHRFYNTEIYLVGKQNNYIYALRGNEKEVICMKTLWTPYNLVALEELLRNNQYLILKGIKSFKEEGEAILNKLVSIEERKLLEGIDFRRMLNYPARQKLYERRLNSRPGHIIYDPKCRVYSGLWMIIDQIDSVLQRDDKHHKDMGFQVVKSQTFYPTSIQLWSEMPVDIIRKASEEHKECMKSLDDVRIQKQPNHTAIGKSSKQKD